MTATIKCPSHSPVEICAILGLNNGGDGLTILDGCGYCDDRGQCHYRGIPQLHRKEHSMPEHREEHKERRKPGRGQISLHAFLRRAST